MPNRQRPRYVSVWLSDAGREALDARAAQENLTRSDLVRRLLTYAAQRMPRGWKP
jgi:hypothetical protein